MTSPPSYEWSRYGQERLLSLRFCDLGLKITPSPLDPWIHQFFQELKDRGIRFRPKLWISDEWYSPEGVPGIALPFYLFHPKLKALQRKMLYQVEGSSKDEFLRIIRHEAGHAIESAYRLASRPNWKRVFGDPKKTYPKSYRPNPSSRKHVYNIKFWYAQSHPVEDFAETFAVWMRPNYNWKKHYKGWPALKKLEYVEELMEELKGKPVKVRPRGGKETAQRDRRTLAKYFEQKRKDYELDRESALAPLLRRLFKPFQDEKDTMPASRFLSRHRAFLRRVVTRWTGSHPFVVDIVLEEMVIGSEELSLRAPKSDESLLFEVVALLTNDVVLYLQSGHYKIHL